MGHARAWRARLWMIGMAVLTISLIAAACGGDDEGEGVAPISGADAPAADDVAATQSQAAAEESQAAAEEPQAAAVDIEATRTVLATQGVTSATDEDFVYFSEVQRAFDLFGSAAAAADQDALEGGDTRDAFFQGLLNAGVGTAFVPVLETLQTLEPTTHYAEDHGYLVSQVERLVATDAEIRDTVLAEDLAAFLLLNAQLARTNAEAALRLQPNLCRTLSRGQANCSSYEVNYDNEYAVALRKISAALQGASAASGQALGGPSGEEPSLQDNLAPEEWSGLIATLFGDRLAAEQEAIAALEELDPPEEFAADHARLIALIETTQAISAAFASEAAAGTLQSLRIDDARLDALASAECGAVAEMSEQFKQVALLVGPTGDEDFERFCAERDA